MSPTRSCPTCERHAPIEIKTGVAYCAICDAEIAPDREPDIEAYTRIYTPEDAARFLAEYYELPEWMADHVLFRCRTFGKLSRHDHE